MERRTVLPLGPPQEHQHSSHQEKLIDIVPCLHHHVVETSHQVFVIQSAHRSQHGGQHHKPNPLVVLEVNAFLLSRTTQHEERDNGHQHPNPLVHIQALAEYQQSTHQCHDRTGRINRPHDGQRQMLHAKITERPRRKHDKRFQQNELMHFPAC